MFTINEIKELYSAISNIIYTELSPDVNNARNFFLAGDYVTFIDQLKTWIFFTLLKEKTTKEA